MDGTQRVVPLAAIWHCLIEGLNPIWPSRVELAGVSLGDVWPCSVLQSDSTRAGDDLVPFHKLTMWITYSLIEVFQRVANWRVDGLEDLTGLPEYRNGTLPTAISKSQCLLWLSNSSRRPSYRSWRPNTQAECACHRPCIRTSKRPSVASCNRRMACDDCDWTVYQKIFSVYI